MSYRRIESVSVRVLERRPEQLEEYAIAPQEGKQEMFLTSAADIAIYGGSAGSGKTFALLLEPLYHIEVEGFGAVIFRRSYPQITRLGGMWDESMVLYPDYGGMPLRGRLEWQFPFKSRVEFAHLQDDRAVAVYQGSQIPLICFDQLEQLTEYQFFYMLSRNRSTCGVRPYVRATCNPAPDSWLSRLLAWWIDEDGYPIEERGGSLRWFVRKGNELLWADRKSDLIVTGDELPKSLTFIPAKLTDNPILMESDPGYLANLQALPYVEQMRLLGGNWLIKEEAGKLFNRAWFEIVDAVGHGGTMCRFWDLAATKKKLKGPEPAFTAGVLMKELRSEYNVMNCISEHVGPAAANRMILNIARQDWQLAKMMGCRYMVRWEEEGGASGKRDTANLVKLLKGFDAAGVRPEGDKIMRAKPFAAQCLASNVTLLAGEWNDGWLVHMHNQPDYPHQDIMDASSGAFNELVKGAMAWAKRY